MPVALLSRDLLAPRGAPGIREQYQHSFKCESGLLLVIAAALAVVARVTPRCAVSL